MMEWEEEVCIIDESEEQDEEESENEKERGSDEDDDDRIGGDDHGSSSDSSAECGTIGDDVSQASRKGQANKKAKKSKPPTLFFCYLLRSLDPQHSRSTYVGFTVNPPRRIRQHNGELGSKSKAGARRTRSKRPWAFVLVVGGFPSKRAALQFEWAWQHPHLDRHVRGRVGGLPLAPRQTVGPRGKLSLLKAMVALDPWCRYGLWLHFPESSYAAAYSSIVVPRSEWMDEAAWSVTRASEGGLEDAFRSWQHRAGDAQHERSGQAEQMPAPLCALCLRRSQAGEAVSSCPSCRGTGHVTCFADKMLAGSETCILPRRGLCPVAGCERQIDWHALVRAARVVGNQN